MEIKDCQVTISLDRDEIDAICLGLNDYLTNVKSEGSIVDEMRKIHDFLVGLSVYKK